MSHARIRQRLAVVLLVSAGLACARQPQGSDGMTSGQGGSSATHNQLSAADRAAGWRLLFDGRTQDGWRVYHGQGQSSGWTVQDGALTKSDATDDIMSVAQFGDFELELEWKLSAGGNAGIFYRGTEEESKIYWTAPEYQLLDDPGHRDGQNRLTSAGAAYGLYPAAAGIVKPAGEWNSTRIIARGPHIEHWLNGTKLLEYELWSPDWEAKVKASKFVEWPKYGRAKRGHIAIQGDHGGGLALRNVRIREL